MEAGTSSTNQRELTEREIGVRELTEQIIDRDRQIAELRQQLEKIQSLHHDDAASISALNVALEENEKSLNLLRHQRDGLQAGINETHKSAAWRLSAPLRLAESGARRVRRILDRVLTGKSAPDHFANGFNSHVGGAPAAGGPADVLDVHTEQKTSDSIGAIRHNLRRAEVLLQAREDALGARYRNAEYVHKAPHPVDIEKLDVKLVAFYVPLFYSNHDSPELETSHWARVVKAVPQYAGHHQPHLPTDVGFYDLHTPGILRRQIELAREHGIWGFCFHYYWAEGKNWADHPIEQFLSDNSLDMKFCVCWMNDSGFPFPDAPYQGHDYSSIIGSLARAFADPRYIRIDGKPVFIVRLPSALTDPAADIRSWRSKAEELGLPGLYLVASRAVDGIAAVLPGFDAAVEYPPHETSTPEVTGENELLDAEFKGRIFRYEDVLEEHTRPPEPPFVNFKGVMPGWDNEAHNPSRGISFTGNTPALFARWLDRSCRTMMARPRKERFVFINAWNNWADGAHLEPDVRRGYANLHVTATVIRNYFNDEQTQLRIQEINSRFVKTAKTAIIFHCYYEDLIDSIFQRFLTWFSDTDLFVTAGFDISEDAVNKIAQLCPNVFFLRQENRGRDIRPFLFALRHIRLLGYELACKVHTKKTPHAETGYGDSWRESLMGTLVGSFASASEVGKQFDCDRKLGILAPEASILDLASDPNHARNTFWVDRLLERMGRKDLLNGYHFHFPAGSMYWFRVDALAEFDKMVLEGDEFERELGQHDGTLAHAVERVVGLYAAHRGYSMRGISRSDRECEL